MSSFTSLQKKSSTASSPSSRHLSVPDYSSNSSSRRSSNASTNSSFHSRQGGLRKKRMTQWKLSVLQNPQLQPIEKLKRFLRSIRIIVEVCLALKGYTKRKKEAPTLMEMQMNLQEDLNKRLTFNPHYYHASYVANKGSSKLKKLLAISPESRTKKHVKSIHTLVQNKRAFCKHPAQIRLKICQVMIYQNYEPRRLIIKQGHPPSAFYIILSGTCLINAKETDSDGVETNQTVNELQEGEVFGEVALLNNSQRTASVVCKSEVELLVIYKDDFDAIIRGPLYRQREGVVQFCSSIPILSTWPIKLLSNSSVVNFYYQYYRKDAVVIKNSATSKFLVFIKSGECRIVCTLDGTEENTKLETPSQSQANTQAMLPLLNQTNPKSTEVQKQQRNSIYHMKRINNKPVIALPAIVNRDETIAGRKSVFIPLQANNMRGRLLSRAEIQPIREDQILQEHRTDYSLGPNRGSQRLQLVRRSIRRSVIEDTPYTIARSERLAIALAEKKRKAESSTDIGASRNRDIFGAVGDQTSPRPKYAQIAVLRAGCTFVEGHDICDTQGLEEMMRRTKLRVALVSDGAECIFISRKLFMKHAGPLTLRCLHSMIGKYPTEDFIRLQLDKQAVWRQFRDDVMKDVLERRDERTALPAFLKAH